MESEIKEDKQQIFSLKKVYGSGRTSLAVGGTLPLDFLVGSESVQLQNELVSELLLAPHFRDYPPSREFRRIFWKCVIGHLEAGGEEVDERIYKALLDLLPTRSSSFEIRPPSPSYNTHFWSPHSDNSTQPQCMQLSTLLESRTMIEGGTTGLRTWGASLEFANWLVRHPDIIRTSRVLELGSGAGFLGLIIATLQMDQLDSTRSSRTSLVLSDVNPEVLSRCRQNFHLPCNLMVTHPSLYFRLLDWTDALDSCSNPDPNSSIMEVLQAVDTIIGADLVYDVSIVPALVAVLVLFFRAKRKSLDSSTSCEVHTPCAYIAMTVRREETVSAFLSSLSYHRLQFEEINMDMHISQKQFLDRTVDAVDCNVTLIKIFSAR